MISLLTGMLVVATLFTGCSKQEEAVDVPDAKETNKEAENEETTSEEAENVSAEENSQKYVIGISLPAMSEYQQTWIDAINSFKDEYNAEIIVTNADNSIEKQVADIESLIVQEPDAIMIRAIDSDGVANSVKAVKDAGIYCIVSSFDVNSEEYDLFLYSQQATTGKMQGEYLREILDANPDLSMNICYLWGVQGVSGCIDRFDGFCEIMFEGTDRAVLLDEKIGNWASAEAMAITEDWIQTFPEANVFVCQSDEMALGVCNALAAAGKNFDEIYVLGIDGADNGQSLIRKGQMDASIYTDLYTDARIQLEHAIGLADGEKYDKNVELETKFVMTIENIDELLDH